MDEQGISVTVIDKKFPIKNADGVDTVVDIDAAGVVQAGVSGPASKYLEAGQQVVDQVKASANSLKDPIKDAAGKIVSMPQLDELALYAHRQGNTVARLVLGNADKLRSDVWDYLTSIGVKVVDTSGNLIPRP